jgi:hypothetical protein
VYLTAYSRRRYEALTVNDILKKERKMKEINGILRQSGKEK